jgi:hypothetical protein
MRLVPQYTVPVHLVMPSNAEVIDEAILVAENVMFEDMLKLPAIRPDMPKHVR